MDHSTLLKAARKAVEGSKGFTPGSAAAFVDARNACEQATAAIALAQYRRDELGDPIPTHIFFEMREVRIEARDRLQECVEAQLKIPYREEQYRQMKKEEK